MRSASGAWVETSAVLLIPLAWSHNPGFSFVLSDFNEDPAD
jgi:hypothetical protein